MKKFREDLKNCLLQRFQNVFNLEEYLLATFLDPRFITKCFSEEKLEIVKILCKNCFLACYKSNLIECKQENN
jgi:hypothetical protein